MPLSCDPLNFLSLSLGELLLLSNDRLPTEWMENGCESHWWTLFSLNGDLLTFTSLILVVELSSYFPLSQSYWLVIIRDHPMAFHYECAVILKFIMLNKSYNEWKTLFVLSVVAHVRIIWMGDWFHIQVTRCPHNWHSVQNKHMIRLNERSCHWFSIAIWAKQLEFPPNPEEKHPM